MAVGVFATVFLLLVGLGALSYRDDRDSDVAVRLAKQREETERFMHSPFEPETISSSSRGTADELPDPRLTQGKSLYEAKTCNACHGDGGVGTLAGPTLVGISGKYPSERLRVWLKQPTEKMRAGGMMPLELTDEEMNSLIAYLKSLK